MTNYTYLREEMDKDFYLSIERYGELDMAEKMRLVLSEIYKSGIFDHDTHNMVMFRLFVLEEDNREVISYPPPMNRSVINITVVF